MGYFRRVPRPPKRTPKPLPRQPRDWRRRTHVPISNGTRDWDGMSICAECSFRADHKIHDLNQVVVIEAAEFEARKLGEADNK